MGKGPLAEISCAYQGGKVEREHTGRANCRPLGWGPACGARSVYLLHSAAAPLSQEMDLLSGFESIEKSADNRRGLPRIPDWRTFCDLSSEGMKAGPHGSTRGSSAANKLRGGRQEGKGRGRICDKGDSTASRMLYGLHRVTYPIRNSFFSFAIPINSSNSSRSSVNGFSHNTCFPASIAAFALA